MSRYYLTAQQTFNSYTENKELKHLFIIINNCLLLILKSLYKKNSVSEIYLNLDSTGKQQRKLAFSLKKIVLF